MPVSRHGATKGVEDILGFTSDALSTARFTVEGLAYGFGLALLQGTGIESLDGGQGISERGRLGGSGWKGEELEVLDARNGNDVVITALRLFGVTGQGRRGSIDCHEVGNGACSKEHALDSRGSRRSGRDANAVERISDGAFESLEG